MLARADTTRLDLQLADHPVADIHTSPSIFIVSLGFTSETGTLIAARTAIRLASLFAGVSGFLWLRFSGKVPGRTADGNTRRATQTRG